MTYKVYSSVDQLCGTITMDSAGRITFTAEPGHEGVMEWLMNAPLIIRDHSSNMAGRGWMVPKPGPKAKLSPYRTITRESEPALWFESLPSEYHGGAFKVVASQ